MIKNLITASANTWCFISSLILSGLFALGVNQLKAEYIYEANQDLFNLTNLTNTTNFNTGDDQLSGAFNLDFTFTLYDEDFTSARMATNGCLHFGLGTGNVNYNNYCGDYTPDPLPHTTYTLYPFWTDLIRDGGSKMLAKNFTDKAVFGWYNMKEYGRNNTDNSFEVILWPNDTFEYRYGGLNITNHDVLIGEQGSATETYTYLFHDECNTGTTNVSGTCVNTNWNGTASNTLLENGGSLYGEGSGNAIDCSDPLNNASCSGYAAAYLTQQCGLDSLHSTSCPLYWEAYDDQQCAEDSQYAPFCAGYTQEASVAYFVEDNFDYGYDEEVDYGYEDEYTTDSYGITNEFVWENDYGYEENIWFEEDYMWEEELLWEDPFVETIDIVDYIENYNYEEEFVFYEEQYEPIQHLDIFDAEELTELYEFETIIREELPYEEEENYLAFENLEELEEWFEEEMDEIQEELEGMEEETEELYAEAEEEIFEEEAVEEIYEDLEEEWVAEAEEETLLEELEELETVGLLADREAGSSMNMETALNVVSSTVQAATNSVSGTTAGTSVHATGHTRASGGTSFYGGSSSGGLGMPGAVASSSSGGGFSTSNSPSISDQVAAASVQTNTILSMSGDTGSVSNVTTTSSPMPTTDTTVEVATVDTQVQDMQGQIDTAMSEVNTASEADQIADQIVAQNLKEQQEQVQASQDTTGEYGAQSVFVAYLGYNASFTDYYGRDIPTQTNWYEPKSIYADVTIQDNVNAFYRLAGDSLNTLTEMRSLQPTL